VRLLRDSTKLPDNKLNDKLINVKFSSDEICSGMGPVNELCDKSSNIRVEALKIW